MSERTAFLVLLSYREEVCEFVVGVGMEDMRTLPLPALVPEVMDVE